MGPHQTILFLFLVFQLFHSGELLHVNGRHRRLDDRIETLVQSSLTNDKCCEREQKLHVVGKTVSGEDMQLDIGKCKKKCSNGRKLKKKDFKRLLEENPTLHPLEIYHLMSSLSDGDSSCSEGWICQASSSRIDRITTSNGMVSVKVIEDCECMNTSGMCHREREIVTMHKNTPLETKVDVGICRGTCVGDLGCRPVYSRSISIEGPNGMECIPVIEKCSCEEACYRSSYFQQYFDYNTGSPQIEVVDIGRCGGHCDEQRGQECVQRESTEGACLMSLIASPSECQAISSVNVLIKNEEGTERNITKIQKCGCR